MATALMRNIPAGQISHFDDLSFAKQGGLMRRARLLIGTDRLAARMAASLGTPLVLRFDRDNDAAQGRPYGLYVGQDAVEVARYVAAHLPPDASPQRPVASSNAPHEGANEPTK
jgi:hypothetical protein